MDFFIKNLEETVDAINKLLDNNVRLVNTKRIRRCNNIKSSNRSKINFIWRSLEFLAEEGILEENGISKPKSYKIRADEPIDVKEFISKIKKKIK
ncbi:MAG: hypothetical protein EU539_10620 [Promethearchaeota archaeon]|nr:MAG: hypothetical protein EU539_10620 [Candidatus Lokiarchaeota archaeon]